MGLLDRLTTGEGSTLSSNDGITPSINPLVNPETSKNFSLHYTSNIDAPGPGDGSPGYSVTGQEFTLVNNYYQSYEDGINTPLPLSSKLDLTDDITVDPDYKPKYTSIPGETYSDLYNSF